jgi:MoaA/NifB/PqqE/SkfB family radical SAM enzyme
VKRNSKPAAVIQGNFCSNSCMFCQKNQHEKNYFELKIKFVESLAKDFREFRNNLKNVGELKKKNFNFIEISGGDPLESIYTYQLIKRIKKAGFEDVQLSTHGMPLSDYEVAKKTVNSGITSLKIPLYGAKSLVHDGITQTKGSFKRTFEGLKNVKNINPNIKLILTTVLMKQNQKELEDLYKLSQILYADLFVVETVKLSNKDYFYALNYAEQKKLIRNFFINNPERIKNMKFVDYPYCVFGFFHEAIENYSAVPVFGSNYEVPDQFKTNIHGLPSYRNKKKLSICSKCKSTKGCDGVLSDYANWSKNSLEALEPVDKLLVL